VYKRQEHADALAQAYDDIRAGLGFTKSPEVFGAVPTDPYSHSPRHLGAQQPGMTGQVKEEVLTRLGELGVKTLDACLHFQPRLLHRAEFIDAPHTFHYVDLKGNEQAWTLPSDTLAFTYCQVPVCYRLSDDTSISITRTDGEATHHAGLRLTPQDSAHIFERDGAIQKILVEIPRTTLRP